MKHYSFALCAVLMLAGGMWGAETDKAEWSVRGYALPPDFIGSGSAVSYGGPLGRDEDEAMAEDPVNLKLTGEVKEPVEKEAPAKIKASIRRTSQVFQEDKRWQLPKGSLVVVDTERCMLAARTNEAGHEVIWAMTEKILSNLPRMVTIQVDILEVSVSEAGELLRQTTGLSDHKRVLEQLEQDGAKLVASAKLEAKSGQRAKTEMVTMVDYATKFEARADGSTQGVKREQEPVGLRVEVDPVTDSEGKSVDLSFSIKQTEKVGAVRMVPLGTLAGKRVEGGVQDFVTESWNTATTLLSGQSRMLGVCPGNDPARARVCFLTLFCPRVQLPADGRAERWLKTYGDAVEPVPVGAVKRNSKLEAPPGMVKMKFRVPPDFLSIGSYDDSDPASVPEDPFAPRSQPNGGGKFKTAKEILEGQGIPFPTGSSAEFSWRNYMLTVVNTPPNMELVEAFVDSFSMHWTKPLQFRVHVVEAASAVVRKLARQSLAVTDHREAWEALQTEVAAGRGRLVAVGAIETKSGQRCTLESGRNYAKASAHLSTQKPEAKADKESVVVTEAPVAEMTATVERVPLGFRFEIDPVLGADGQMIDVNLSVERESREPLERFEAPVAAEGVLRVDAPSVDFHPQKLTTALTTFDGMWRMIGTWQPTGADGNLDPEVMQAVFLQAVVMKVVPDE